MRDVSGMFNKLSINDRGEPGRDRMKPLIYKRHKILRDDVFEMGSRGNTSDVKYHDNKKECKICKEVCKDHVTDHALERIYLMSHGKAMPKNREKAIKGVELPSITSSTVEKKNGRASLADGAKRSDPTAGGVKIERKRANLGRESRTLDGRVTLKDIGILDLMSMRKEVSRRLSKEMTNDKYIPQTLELQRIIEHHGEQSSKYYITDLHLAFEAVVKSGEMLHHISHFTNIMKVLETNHMDVVEGDEDHLFDMRMRFNQVHGITKRVKIEGKPKKKRDDEEEVLDWLVFGLEEVLVNTAQVYGDHYDFVIQESDLSKKKYKVTLRPFLFEFLARMKNIYNLMIYTTSQRAYTDKILDLIDPKGIIFKVVLCSDFCLKPSALSDVVSV